MLKIQFGGTHMKLRTHAPILLLLSFLLIFSTSCASAANALAQDNQSVAVGSQMSDEIKAPETTKTVDPVVEPVNLQSQPVTDDNVSDLLSIHFLDVGQADSILIQLPNDEVILIDAGNGNDVDFIIDYLKQLDIKTIDYLIGTHPHEDHIGSLDDVIYNFEIEKVFLPDVVHTTASFEDVLLAIESKNLAVDIAESGVNLFDYGNLLAHFVAPNSSSYDDLNDYSAVLRVVYENTAYLFTGDAEVISENEMLASSQNIQADLVKVGHHGSNSSSSEDFLKAINPSIAIISCGIDNTYGHPSDVIIDRLAAFDIEVYRTDLQGTIIITSDGEEIDVTHHKSEHSASAFDSTTKQTNEKIEPTLAPSPSPSPEPEPTLEAISTIVYVTKTGSKYHEGDCSYLSKSKIELDLNSAKSQGYDPCSRCNPPK